jgi:hypothetical protein
MWCWRWIHCLLRCIHAATLTMRPPGRHPVVQWAGGTAHTDRHLREATRARHGAMPGLPVQRRLAACAWRVLLTGQRYRL